MLRVKISSVEEIERQPSPLSNLQSSRKTYIPLLQPLLVFFSASTPTSGCDSVLYLGRLAPQEYVALELCQTIFTLAR